MQTLAANTDEGSCERSETRDRMDIRLRAAAGPCCGAGIVVERGRTQSCARDYNTGHGTGVA